MRINILLPCGTSSVFMWTILHFVNRSEPLWTDQHLCGRTSISVDGPVSCGRIRIFVDDSVSLRTILYLMARISFFGDNFNFFSLSVTQTCSSAVNSIFILWFFQFSFFYNALWSCVLGPRRSLSLYVHSKSFSLRSCRVHMTTLHSCENGRNPSFHYNNYSFYSYRNISN